MTTRLPCDYSCEKKKKRWQKLTIKVHLKLSMSCTVGKWQMLGSVTMEHSDLHDIKMSLAMSWTQVCPLRVKQISFIAGITAGQTLVQVTLQWVQGVEEVSLGYSLLQHPGAQAVESNLQISSDFAFWVVQSYHCMKRHCVLAHVFVSGRI